MKPGSGKDSTYVLEVDKWKFIVFTDLDRMDLTSFVSIAPGIAVRSDYCIRAMEDRTGKYDIRLHMGYSEEEQRIVLRNCEIGHPSPFTTKPYNRDQKRKTAKRSHDTSRLRLAA